MNKIILSGLILLLLITETISFTLVSGQNATLYHNYIRVDAKNYQYVDIYVDEPGTTVTIVAYIYTTGGSWSDIDIAIIKPDGSLELAKQRYKEVFEYSFTAYMGGKYKLLLDNSYSILTVKIVDLAIMKDPPPVIVTHTYTTTLTQTLTKTTTQTIVKNNTITVVDTTSTVAISTILLIVGLIAGYFMARRKTSAKQT